MFNTAVTIIASSSYARLWWWRCKRTWRSVPPNSCKPLPRLRRPASSPAQPCRPVKGWVIIPEGWWVLRCEVSWFWFARPGRDGLGNAGFGRQRGADRLGIGEGLRRIMITFHWYDSYKSFLSFQRILVKFGESITEMNVHMVIFGNFLAIFCDFVHVVGGGRWLRHRQCISWVLHRRQLHPSRRSSPQTRECRTRHWWVTGNILLQRQRLFQMCGRLHSTYPFRTRQSRYGDSMLRFRLSRNILLHCYPRKLKNGSFGWKKPCEYFVRRPSPQPWKLWVAKPLRWQRSVSDGDGCDGWKC